MTPARVGELGRVLFLEGPDRLKGVGTVIVDKLFDLLGILLLSLVGAWCFLGRSVFLMLLSLVIVGIATLLISKKFKQNVEPLFNKRKFGKKIIDIISAFEAVSINVLLNCMVLTLIMFMIVLFQCYMLLLTFYKLPLPFNVVFFAFPLVILSNILPITIGGLGVREYVAVFCLSFFDIPAEVSFTATFYLFIINVFIPSVFGYFIILRTTNVAAKN